MRVCFLHRPGAGNGGDWSALARFSLAMLRAGVDVDERPADQPGDLSSFDTVHLWAACSPDWGLPAARAVKAQGKRLVITPFWWSRAERQAAFGRAGQDLAPGYTPAVAETLRLADVLFPVTMSESVECWKLAPGAPVWTVPMGIDRSPVALKPAEDFVLCVGRVEPHKNQALLATVCKALGFRLVLVGQRAHVGYYGTIDKTVDSFVFVDDQQRWDLLARARVHALPSFFENPGLAHGEALALGVPAVMGGHGCEPEFYGPAGNYCDPNDPEDIARALRQAWDAPRAPRTDLPTWGQAAARALEWLKAPHSCSHSTGLEGIGAAPPSEFQGHLSKGIGDAH